ncbi:V-type H+-transporting ATPase subunit d [Nematocida sp. LUAm3]|nr:V-type H+-transporting ATPase subunit d [Nematocida sp. LUAm3]KAI5174767.1 V-type H+-transporting ATPase subunit d [Nematocida sp. LUAm2]KAI5177822.1 V-type H+-transporting ATPase subunit d [Nematocida sp. LUAm1]
MQQEACIISYAHGNKNSLIKAEEYRTIQTSSTLEDLKTKLQSSVYGKCLLEEPQNTPKVFKNVLYNFLKTQMDITLSFSTDLSRRLVAFYKESFQLRNFIYLWACKQEGVKTLEHADDLHPLGDYDELSFINVTHGAEDTWKFCLENTPLHKYIQGLSYDVLNQELPYLTNILYKKYLEQFYAFTVQNNLCLSEVIQFEGDKRIIEILYSTLDSTMPIKDKLDLFPSCSTFSSLQKALLANCKTIEELKGILSTHRVYRNVVACESGIEISLRKEEIRVCKSSFYHYNDPSIVYTQLKLQEIEISTLVFIAECISQGRMDDAQDIIEIDLY